MLRCFQRHGIGCLPEIAGDRPAKKKFAKNPIGYFHIDIAEVRTEVGELYLPVAIGRTSKFAYAQLHESAMRRVASDFLRTLATLVSYKIHTVLTDNGTQFVDNTPAPAPTRQAEPKVEGPLLYRRHAFEYACEQLAIEHHLTRTNHPWTNGQVERMNRTLKEATVKRYY